MKISQNYGSFLTFGVWTMMSQDIFLTVVLTVLSGPIITFFQKEYTERTIIGQLTGPILRTEFLFDKLTIWTACHMLLTISLFLSTSIGAAMPYGIKEFFNGRGYEAEFKSDGTVEILKEPVGSGTPVIVFIRVEKLYETTHNTHYISLIGYDHDYFYCAESLDDYANCKDEKDVPNNRKTDFAKFERLWANIDGIWDYPYFVIIKNNRSYEAQIGLLAI